MNGNIDEALEQYIPLVHMVVGQMEKSLSSQADEDELFSFGMTGLWDASRKFNPDLGVKFETYAIQRIRGEMIDGLRKTDHVSRTLRKKEKTIRDAKETLEQTYLRRPTGKEVSDYLGMTTKEYEQTLRQLSFIKQDSLDSPLNQDDANGKNPYQYIEDHYHPRQEEWLEASERKKTLAALIDKLPEREKLILALVYYENLSLTDVSKVLGVHKSRISQLHMQAVKRLRAEMNMEDV